MNILKNSLILFGSDCRIQVFGLEGGKDSSIETAFKLILFEILIFFVHLKYQRFCSTN